MPPRGSIQGVKTVAAEVLQRPPHGVGELPAQPVEMAPISAFRQHAVQNMGPGGAIAHGRGELEIDKLRDPLLPRGDIAATHRGADGLGGAADLHHPAQAVERGEPRRRLGLEIRERVVLENENVVLLCEAQHAMDGRRRGRRPRRVMQAAGGQIEARTMLGEQAFEFRDVGAVEGHGDGEAPGAIGAQERMEIEVAGIVDNHCVVWAEEKAAGEIERLRAGIGDDDLVGIGHDRALGEAHREEPAQRRIAERLVILAPALRILPRGEAQRPLHAEIEHPGIGQPASARTKEIGRVHHRVPIDPGRIDRGLRRRVHGRERERAGGARDEESGASPSDDRALGYKPVVSLDDGRFRDFELDGELTHRGQACAARERPARYAAANERRGRLDARGGPIVHIRSELYSQWIGTV